MDKWASEAVKAYFTRVKNGEASDTEIAILPTMLDKFASIKTDEHPVPEYLVGMSEEGRKGGFPQEGLVNADEVCRVLGKAGVKKKTESLMYLVRNGRLPAPRETAPYRWDAKDIRDFISELRGGGRAYA